MSAVSSTARVLVACEYSGRVRSALRTRGIDAWSCDILPAEDGPTVFHVQDRLERVVSQFPFWDMLIAHPPCTYLCNSGVRWLHTEPGRMEKMREGAEFFRWILSLPIPLIAVENPVMHKYAREIIGRGPDFTCQPWQFGDDEKKRTCWWTKGLPPLVATSDLDGSTASASVHRAPPSANRWRDRSRTFPGMAQAIADQWGRVLTAHHINTPAGPAESGGAPRNREPLRSVGFAASDGGGAA